MVVPLFKHVKNTDARKYAYTFNHHPWAPEQLKNKIYIVPLNEENKVFRINFPVPDVQDQYKTSVSCV